MRDRSSHIRERLRPQNLRAPSLDWLNFLIADVRGGLGPYVVVFLIAEQGLGDTLNFVRYVPLVAARGARVILGVQHPLKSIAPSVPGVDWWHATRRCV